MSTLQVRQVASTYSNRTSCDDHDLLVDNLFVYV